ncbi:restriction endonuclease subunit S [Pediococcus acidilactici]|uniref:restriction endonuclease subunit S n=1 Tax=Pediococcus acidilactici TaxID=1254 RepID=UPI00293635D4|nr:restriction endonuclease subunit S [Pediococcus acidilactici]MDV2602880.1 restriction endonuclease subunit S [Pediococcus acidilactici]
MPCGLNDNLLELGLSLLTNTNFKKYQLLNDVLEVKDGTHSSPANVSNGGHPLVTSKAIKGVSVDFSQTKNISEVDFTEINKRSLVEYHDILISMIGTVGIVHLVTEKPVNYAIKNVGLIKSSNNEMLATFLYFYLLSNHGQTYIKENLSGSTQQFISLTNLRKMQIPLLSEISSELLKQLNYMAQQIEENSKENNILTSIKNSLLEKFF